ncbi:MAG TPA: glycosyltransferase [Flavobacteriales bacterium]|nr:glycosyltransferase [Flavobacteriales bacterium]
MKILFTYLSGFTGVGGIEKFNKAFIKALTENFKSNETDIASLYDSNKDTKYLSDNFTFKAFKGNRLIYLIKTVLSLYKYDLIILGHVNLSIIAIVYKIMFPKRKLIIITHGIDVWENITFTKKWALKKADLIFSVSSYTKEKIKFIYNIHDKKVKILHNTIDPYFDIPCTYSKPKELKKKYNLNDEKILITVARLSKNEGYKGYDKIISVIPEIIKHIPNFKYIIIGKYDEEEVKRISKLIDTTIFDSHVIITGYVPENELVPHFMLADAFAMPSNNEGFGIVFIEAMICGIPVIAGNKDGSTDALLHGDVGTLVDPDNLKEIQNEITNTLLNPLTLKQKEQLREIINNNFGFETFKKNQKELINQVFKCAE